MFLSDFQKAIDSLVAALGSDCTMCFNKVSCNTFGNCFIFSADVTDTDYRVWRGGRVEKIYSDTWRNPTHREIITEGDGKEIW